MIRRSRCSRRSRSRTAAGAVLAAVAALLVTELAAAGPALAAPAAPESAAGTTTSGSRGTVTLTLTKLTPAALTPSTPLVVSGTARNTGGTTIRTVKVRLRLHEGLLDDRTTIDDWLGTGSIGTFDAVLPGSAKLRALAPGASVPFTLTVPKGRIGLSALSSFGPRGMALEAMNGSTRLGELRTTVVWSPPGVHPTKTRLSLLVPFTGTWSENAGAPTTEVAQSFENGGRMQRLQEAASDPAVSWAIDPAVLESAQRLVSSGVVSSADADPLDGTPAASPSAKQKDGGAGSTDTAAAIAATGWLNAVRSGRTDHTVFALPYADPDLTSLFRSTKGAGLLRTADRLGRAAVAGSIGGTLDTTVAWPGDGQVTPAGISALAGRVGRTAIVLPADSQPPTPAVSYTPTGRSAVRNGSANLAGLLYDDQLSTLFTASGSLGGSTGPAVAAQTMLAQLAAISMQLPGQPRDVLAVAPRTWDPSPAAVQTLLADLHASDWVSLRGLGDLRAATSSTPRDEPSYHKVATGSELPIGNVSGATAMIRDLDTLAPALTDSDTIVGPLQEQVVSLLSLSWRSNKQGLSPARSDVRDDVEQLVGGVRLLIGTKKKTFAAHSASIQIFVYNDTEYPMHLLVQLVPGSGQLAITQKVPVVAAAQSRTPVLVPARAIANGNVVVQGRLLTTKGKQLGPTESFTLRARPDWETGGTIGAGVILGLLLVFGLIRGIGRARGRTRIPPHSVPDVDDQATGRMPPEPDRVSTAPDEPPERSAPNHPDQREHPTSADTDPRGGDADDLGTRDLGASPQSPRPIARAEKRPRAASETRPETVPAPSDPGAGTAPGDPRRPAISRKTR